MHWCPVHGYDCRNPVLAWPDAVRVAGPDPNPPAQFFAASRQASLPAPPGIAAAPPRAPALAVPPRMVPTPTSATPAGPPGWYRTTVAGLDATLTGAIHATARSPAAYAQDVFYLDRLIEALRAWDKKLLAHANVIRGAIPKKGFP